MRRISIRAEHGIVLPFAMAFLIVLAITVVAVLEFSSSTQRTSDLSEAELKAADVAEAGLNQAQSILANASDPDTAAALPASCGASPVVSVEGGTACYWGTLDTGAAPHEWTVGATSTVMNPTGGSPLTRTVTRIYQVTPDTAITGNEAWNYVFSNTTTSCFQLSNNFDVYTPLYVQGNMCSSNDGDYAGPLLDVRGTLEQSGSADVGSSASPVPQARIAGGCRLGSSGSFQTPCTSAQRVWASSFSSSPPALTKPVLDPTYWRANAKPGPNQYCTSGSFPGGAASFTTLSTVNLTPASSYDCTVTQGAATVGRISWNNSSSVLAIQGVVWFDGDVEVNGNFNGTYTGSGVIYARTVSLRNDAKLCALAGCPTTGWDPNIAFLAVAASSTASNAISLENATKFQGGVYAVGGFVIQNSATTQGPVVAETISVANGGLLASWPALGALLPGMPSNNGTLVVKTVPGSWRG